ncbi:MAG TPA: NAD(P)/FAD-dependent oxidoreductase [Firmicutes bacterium]|nr:NAD(P)/FAD-dependent oxidoreductase [Candidatus Fermentithermobacillaceae bacterium]
MAKWDVIIVGAGPAGIFAAIELVKKSPGLSVLMLEKGRSLEARTCPRETNGGGCVNCSPCSITSGWGGAGAFSDGKLTLTTRFGGFLGEYLAEEELKSLIDYIDHLWIEFGASSRLFGTDEEAIAGLVAQAARAGLDFLPAKIRHLGTDHCPEILRNMRMFLEPHVEIRTSKAVERFTCDGGKVTGVVLADGSRETADLVIAAPGREGAEWFSDEARRLGLETENNPVDVGVRVEVPAVVADPVTEKVWEPKIHYYSKSFDDLVRTFCVCPHGEVVTENTGGVITVNGHSWSEKRTENSNFAVLVSKTFTEPFKEPIAYGKYIASLANMLGGGVLVQRLGDLWEGRRSTAKRLAKSMVRPTLKDATPGDLTLVLPYRHVRNILEMLEALDKIMPGIWSRNTLLYGVEVKFYSSRVKVDSSMETGISGLFAVGDGAGVTRSLAQASAAGVKAARSVLDRLGRTGS